MPPRQDGELIRRLEEQRGKGVVSLLQSFAGLLGTQQQERPAIGSRTAVSVTDAPMTKAAQDAEPLAPNDVVHLIPDTRHIYRSVDRQRLSGLAPFQHFSLYKRVAADMAYLRNLNLDQRLQFLHTLQHRELTADAWMMWKAERRRQRAIAVIVDKIRASTVLVVPPTFVTDLLVNTGTIGTALLSVRAHLQQQGLLIQTFDADRDEVLHRLIRHRARLKAGTADGRAERLAKEVQRLHKLVKAERQALRLKCGCDLIALCTQKPVRRAVSLFLQQPVSQPLSQTDHNVVSPSWSVACLRAVCAVAGVVGIVEPFDAQNAEHIVQLFMCAHANVSEFEAEMLRQAVLEVRVLHSMIRE
eukprot:TRINITY_DN5855_c0_g1_i3.p1 TRINITY_DN5855_c0_g1~~TRINITY_DN5855_c0_g1_i3.p1  ORF type:complete len:358 (+),score=96.08 TRINITY_DN5855_c0_g1_i3:284-1357(+)